ncbi:MAG: 2-hydroxyacyl-CoA dehydratase subunit D [Bacillota bacterium]
MSDNKGLARAAQIYSNRYQRAEELKAQGQKVAGYVCCYVPVEILEAAGYLPFRILGDANEAITEADSYLPTVMCSFMRSCLDLAMKGKYDFMDAFIGCHACDAAERVSAIWRSYKKYPVSFFLDLPHTAHPAALEFSKDLFTFMIASIEEKTGEKISVDKIREKVDLYNKQRQMVRQLYNLRKQDPPPVSGSEILQVMVSLLSLPAVEGNALLEEVLEEVKGRVIQPQEKKSRVLIWGSLIDNIALTKLIEDCGFDIVMDDTAIGSRTFGHEVQVTDDPLDGLVDRYLNKLVCPQCFRETGKTRDADLENRFGYLKKFAQDWKADAVILNIIRNCDVHGYEVPELKHYLKEAAGLPVMSIEQDYSTAALETLRTRFQAFAESIEVQ